MVLGWGHAGPPSDFITSAHMYRMPGMRRALGSACACGPVPYLTYCLISLRPKLWADFNPVGENVIFSIPRGEEKLREVKRVAEGHLSLYLVGLKDSGISRE